MRDAAVVIVFVIRVIAAAVLLIGSRFLFIVAGDQKRKLCADDGDSFITVSAAAGGIADEGEPVAAGLPGVGDAGSERGYIAVGATHDGKTGHTRAVVVRERLRFSHGGDTTRGGKAG